MAMAHTQQSKHAKNFNSKFVYRKCQKKKTETHISQISPHQNC